MMRADDVRARVGERAKGLARSAAVAVLQDALGMSGPRSAEAAYEGLWWMQARAKAVGSRVGLLDGVGIVWMPPGRVDLRRVEVPLAGPGEVTVDVLMSAISPGTERARFLGLPNARVSLPHRPGYSLVGRVIAVGEGIGDLELGSTVAVTGAPHQSVVTVPASAAHPVPDGVAPADAALVQLGVIAGQGVRRARPPAGRPLVVIGAGPIGVLAARLAQAGGAGPATLVASSRRRAALAREAAFVSLADDADALDDLRAPTVFEASGAPSALATALEVAEDGARIVLLGSSRGVPAPLPVEQLRRRRLALVGAHVDSLRYEAAILGNDPSREEVGRYMGALADDRIRVDDLHGAIADPRDASQLYRRLVDDPALIGAMFDWRQLDPRDKARRGSLIRLPDVRARGADFTAKPLPAPGPGRPAVTGSEAVGRRNWQPQTADEVFAQARGDLRIAMVGCGEIAVQNAAAVAQAPNARAVAFFDPNTALARDLADTHGTGRVAPDMDAVLGSDDVDAVFLSVPHHLHAPLAVDAARAGKHVIVEKPPANDLPSAVRMARACAAADVILSVCFPFRYDGPNAAAFHFIAAGGLGSFEGASLSYMADKPASYLHGGYTGRAASDWRTSREKAGGGVFITNLSHYVDLIRFLSGADAEEVHAVVSSVERPHDIEDTISVSARYRNGAVASLFGSAKMRGAKRSELRLWGSDGHVEVEPSARFMTQRALDGLAVGHWQELPAAGPRPSRAVFVSRLATALADGAPPDAGAEDALAVQAFIEAAYRSAASGRAERPAELIAEAEKELS